jgi:organic hydroperoxide reductase OsmC/OhrA
MPMPNTPTNQNDATNLVPVISKPLLGEHPALTPLIPHMRSGLLKVFSESTGEIQSFQATEIEDFSIHVFGKVNQLDTALTSLRMALGYILNPATASDISSSEFRYHYENFLFRVEGVCDRSHRLAGASFRLNAKKFEAPGGNNYVQKTIVKDAPEVHRALIAIKKVVVEFKESRNDVIHSSAFSSPEITVRSLYETFPELEEPAEMRTDTGAVFIARGGVIEAVLEELNDALDILLTALSPFYLAAPAWPRMKPAAKLKPQKIEAEILWLRDGQDFLDNRYSRRHLLRFDGGLEVPGSSSPHVVALPLSDAAAVDPEEAFVASLASCHMLWFLSIAAQRKFCVDRYVDAASGVMARNDQGKMAMTVVTLHPQVAFSGEQRPTRIDIEQMHHAAHEECFIANSVKTEVRCEPVHSACPT